MFPAAMLAIADLVWAARGTSHPDEHVEEMTNSGFADREYRDL
jgi:hypothetical protein